ncbi:MAG: PilZ domain-containing protein [Deltaproteobacteria bacterium]|nr:PilZ domain-containing protein [Deltaproteobacteria bacterium]
MILRGTSMAATTQPVLVYGDVSDAGFELLARQDLDLRWALNLEEATAVTRALPLSLVLTSDAFALDYLTSIDTRSRPPVVVLVHGQAGWQNRDRFRTEGALALVSAHDRKSVVAAISEVTGLAFRYYPRVPFQGIVDVTHRGETFFLPGIDLSASGISVRDFPTAQHGDLVDIAFDIEEQPVSVSAMVIRSFESEGVQCVGLSFLSLPPEFKQRIARVVETEKAVAEDAWRNAAAAGASPGGHTMDVIRELGGGESVNQTYFEMLRHAVRSRSKTVAVLPSWLGDVRRRLVSEERRFLRDEPTSSWAEATVRARIDLGRQGLGFDGDPVYGPALELCALLGDQAATSPPDVLTQVTQVRADLLRATNVLVLASREAGGGAPTARIGDAVPPAHVSSTQLN